MTISEKVAYLKGLAEGMELDTEKNKEGKLISMMMDILNDIALEIEDIEGEQADMFDEIDAISDDLSDVEEVIFDEDEDEDEDDYDYDDDDEEDCFESTCPKCGDKIFFDDTVLEDGEVICPNCGEKLVFDLSDLAEDEESDD